MLRSLFIIALVFLGGQSVKGGRILLVGIHLPSHLIEQHEIGQELSRRGHSVYFAIDESFPTRERLEKHGLTAVTFRSSNVDIPQFWSNTTNSILMSAIMGKKTLTMVIPMQLAMQDCSNMMLDEEFLSKITALNIDLVIFDGFFYCKCNVIIAHRLSVPAVHVSSELTAWAARVPANPAVTPIFNFLLHHSDRMTFLQRLANMAAYATASMYQISELNTTLLRRFAPEVTSWNELVQRKTLLYIVTRDYLLEWPEPTMPNIIHTPGVTTHPAGELPRHLKDLMDVSRDGVIILSFGSITGQLPKEIIKTFLRAFSQLKQTVIFKYGGQNETFFSDIAKNVHLLSWLPQNDLLGHPNTVLFITHCGNNGQYESLYHGVPMIGFPLFAEQHHNAFRMVHHGYGVEMNILKFTADELVNNIHKVLEERSFKMAVQKASDIVKTRPMTAQETAAYWVEHVLMYGGEHLRTGAMDMPLYQFLMLDILLFILTVCFLSGYVLKTVFALLYQRCLVRQTKQKQQ